MKYEDQVDDPLGEEEDPTTAQKSLVATWGCDLDQWQYVNDWVFQERRLGPRKIGAVGSINQ